MLPYTQGPGSLPGAESVPERVFGIPWFKHDVAEDVVMYAKAFKKVALQAHKVRQTPCRPRSWANSSLL
jgi:hypothetical protein